MVDPTIDFLSSFVFDRAFFRHDASLDAHLFAVSHAALNASAAY